MFGNISEVSEEVWRDGGVERGRRVDGGGVERGRRVHPVPHPPL